MNRDSKSQYYLFVPMAPARGEPASKVMAQLAPLKGKLAMARKSSKKVVRCSVCKHPERLLIERARLAGATCDEIARDFGVSRDAAWRHCRDHIPDDRRAQIIADIPLKQLAEKAQTEGASLLDHFLILRKLAMQQLLQAHEEGDRQGFSSVAGRLNDILRDMGKLTGELQRMSSVTIGNAVFVNSPAFTALNQMLLARLAKHPDALAQVVAGLQELEQRHKLIEGHHAAAA